jgi:hypothetical protein
MPALGLQVGHIVPKAAVPSIPWYTAASLFRKLARRDPPQTWLVAAYGVARLEGSKGL